MTLENAELLRWSAPVVAGGVHLRTRCHRLVAAGTAMERIDLRPVHVDELAFRLHGDYPVLDEVAPAIGPPLVERSHPPLEQGRYADQGGLEVPDGQGDGWPGPAGDDVGRGQDDVEGAGQNRAVDHAGCPLVGGGEGGTADGFGWLELDGQGQGERIARSGDDVEWHERGQGGHVVRSDRPVGEPRRRRRAGYGDLALQLIGQGPGS